MCSRLRELNAIDLSQLDLVKTRFNSTLKASPPTKAPPFSTNAVHGFSEIEARQLRIFKLWRAMGCRISTITNIDTQAQVNMAKCLELKKEGFKFIHLVSNHEKVMGLNKKFVPLDVYMETVAAFPETLPITRADAKEVTRLVGQNAKPHSFRRSLALAIRLRLHKQGYSIWKMIPKAILERINIILGWETESVSFKDYTLDYLDYISSSIFVHNYTFDYILTGSS